MHMNMAAKQETTVQDSVLTFLNLKPLNIFDMFDTVGDGDWIPFSRRQDIFQASL